MGALSRIVRKIIKGKDQYNLQLEQYESRVLLSASPPMIGPLDFEGVMMIPLENTCLLTDTTSKLNECIEPTGYVHDVINPKNTSESIVEFVASDVQTQSVMTIFFDDFSDGNMDGWYRGDWDSGSGSDYWGLVNDGLYAPQPWCAAVSDGGATVWSDYDNDMQAYMYHYIDLSGYDGCYLQFDYYLASEETYDELLVHVYADGGWSSALWSDSGFHNWDGSSSTTVDLSSYDGKEIYIEFEFRSDSSVERTDWEGDGAWVDNIRVKGSAVSSDLTKQTDHINSTSAFPGDTLEVDLTIVNSGSNSANSSYVYYYWKKGSKEYSDTYKVGQDYVKSLSPQDTSDESFEFTVPAGSLAGTYYLYYWIDAREEISESIETNNKWAWTVTVNEPTKILSVDFEPDDGSQGTVDETKTVTVSVGAEIAQPGVLQVWMYDDDFSTQDTEWIYIDAPQSTVRTFELALVESEVGARDYSTYIQFRPNVTTGPFISTELYDSIWTGSDYTIDWNGIPDLTRQTDHINSTSAFPGDTLEVDLTIVNSGSNSANSSYVYYYWKKGSKEYSDTYKVGQDYVKSLSPQDTSDESFEFTVPAGSLAGTYYLYYWIDAREEISESIETNNKWAWTVTVNEPTKILSVDFEPDDGSQGTVDETKTVTVSVGAEIAQPGVLQVWMYDDDFSTQDTEWIYIDAPQSTVRTFELALVESEVGARDYSTYIQFRPNVTTGPFISTELYDSIWTGSDYTIDWNGIPDLTRQMDHINSTSAFPGDTLEVDLTIVNNGSISANSSYVYYYWKKDSKEYSDTYKVGQDYVESLSPQDTSDESFEFTVPAGSLAGTYYLYYWIDAREEISESIETNNKWAWTVTVNEPTKILSVDFEPDDGSQGTVDETKTVTVSVGAEIAQPGVLQVWMYDDDFSTQDTEWIYIDAPQSTVRTFELALVESEVGARDYSTYIQFRPNVTTGPFISTELYDSIWTGSDYTIDWDGIPDLEATLTILSNGCYWGDQVGFEVGTENTTGVPTNHNWKVYLVMSPDSNVTITDYILDEWLIPIGSGEWGMSLLEELPATPPSGFSSDGIVYFGLIADVANNIIEQNEINNIDIETIRISKYNNPPTIDILVGPGDGDTINYDDVKYEWSGYDSDGYISGYEVKMDDSGWSTANKTMTFPNLSEGKHEFSVRAIDNDNQYSNWSHNTFNVDLDENQEPGDTIAYSYDLGTLKLNDSKNITEMVGNGLHLNKDIDIFKISLEDNAKVTFDIDTTPPVSSLDSYLRLFDSYGSEIAFSDDEASPGESNTLDSFLERYLSVGTYYIGVSGYPNVRYLPSNNSSAVSGSTGNYTLSVTVSSPEDQPQDIRPLDVIQLSGDFEETSDGLHTATGTIVVNDFLTVIGTITYDDELNIHGDGEVWVHNIPIIGDAMLMDDEFDFPAGEVITDKLNGALSSLAVAGLDLKLDRFLLVENGVRLEGALKLPDLMGGTEIKFANPHFIDITTEGLFYDFVVTPNDLSFKLNKLEFISEDVELAVSNADGQAEATLSGLFTVNILGTNISVDLDKEQGRYFRFSQSGDWDLVGTIMVDRVDFLKNKLYVEDLIIDLDTTEMNFHGEGWIHLPIGNGVNVFGTLEIVQGYLDSVGLTVSELDVLVWSPPPIYLDTIGGSVQNMTPDEIDGEPTLITVNAGFQLGPDIGDYNLIYLDLNGWVDMAGGMGGSAGVKLGNPDDPFAGGNVSVSWFPYKDLFTLDGNIFIGDSEDPIVGLEGSLASSGDVISGQLEGGIYTKHIPGWVKDIYKGWNIINPWSPHFGDFDYEMPDEITGQAYFIVSDDGNEKNDFIMVGSKDLLTVKIILDGDFNVFDDIKAVKFKELEKLIDDDVANEERATALSGLDDPGSAVIESYNLPVSLEGVVFQLEWENNSAGFEIFKPDGTRITIDNVDDYSNITVVENSESHLITFVVYSPTGGVWQTAVPDTTNIGNYTIRVQSRTNDPVISLLEPHSDISTTSVDITWVDEDNDSDALISLYYDDDRYGADGILIAAGIPEDDATDYYNWDLTNVPAGDYYVYAVIEDGVSTPGISYATGRVSVIDANAPEKVTGLNAPEGTHDSIQLRWQSSGAEDLDHYLAYYTANAAGENYQQQVVADKAASVVITDLVPGETYRIAIAAVDTEGNIGICSDPIVVVIGGVTSVAPEADQWSVFADPGVLYQAQIPGALGDSYSLINGPDTSMLNESGLFEWFVPSDAFGWHSVLVHVTHSTGSTSVYRYHLLSDNRVPEFTDVIAQVEAISPNAVQIISPDGMDSTGVVHYQLERDGEIIPEWQIMPVFIDLGLYPNKYYDYRLRLKDSSPTSVPSDWSDIITVCTLADIPNRPSLMTINQTTLILEELPQDSNPEGTEYAIYCTTTGQYLTTDGVFSQEPVWISIDSWSDIPIGGLLPDMEYKFVSIVRNHEGFITEPSTVISVHTAREDDAPIVSTYETDSSHGTISLEFSESIMISIKDISVYDSNGTPVTLAGAQLSHTPASLFAQIYFNNVLNEGSYTLVLNGNNVQDLSGNLLNGGQDEFIDFEIVPDTAAPEILSWQSAKMHNTGEALLTIPDDGSFSEPRLVNGTSEGGISTLLITFDEAIDTDSFRSDSIAVVGNDLNGNTVDLSEIQIMTNMRNANTVGEVTFNPALPDFARYLIRLEGITDMAGNPLESDNDRIMTSLLGDATGDLRVNNTDVGGVKSLRGINPIDLTEKWQVRSDANLDGRINNTDVGGIKSMRGRDARFIFDPVIPEPTLLDDTLNEDSYFNTADTAKSSVLSNRLLVANLSLKKLTLLFNSIKPVQANNLLILSKPALKEGLLMENYDPIEIFLRNYL